MSLSKQAYSRLTYSHNTAVSDNTANKIYSVNPLSANPIKWANTLKQFVGFCQRIV